MKLQILFSFFCTILLSSNSMEQLPSDIVNKILFHALKPTNQISCPLMNIILVSKKWYHNILNNDSYIQTAFLINYLATLKKMPRETVAKKLHTAPAKEYIKKGKELLQCQHIEQIICAIKDGADINFQNTSGISLMFNVVIQHTNYEGLQFLLKMGASPQITSAQGFCDGTIYYNSSTQTIFELFKQRTPLPQEITDPSNPHHIQVQCYELLKKYVDQNNNILEKYIF